MRDIMTLSISGALDAARALLWPPPAEESLDKNDKAASEPERKPTGLLDLPAEIWSKIGHYTIDREYVYVTKNICEPDCLPLRHIEFDGVQWPHQPAITRTCRVLREELLGYYYRTKVSIILHLDPSVQDHIRDFLKNIGPSNRRHIILVWAMCKKGRPMGPSRKIVSHHVGDLPLELVPEELDSYGKKFAKGECYAVKFL